MVVTDEDDRERSAAGDPPPEPKTAAQSSWDRFAESRVYLPQAVARLVERLKGAKRSRP
jgi:hypothetical protein